MSDQTKDGGYAFPVSVKNDQWMANRGMTLLDWFAGQALEKASRMRGCVTADAIAARAYFIADAMLAEREKRNVAI